MSSRIWLTENSPMSAGMNDTPSNSSMKPPEKRMYPSIGSVPTSATSSPRQPEISPLSRLPDVSVTMLDRPRIASRKYSGGPNSSATRARGGATNSSASVEMMPPQKLATVATAMALPPSPFRVIG